MPDVNAQLNANSRAEFGELLEHHRAIVFKVASTYAWHAEDRADLSQEIAAQLWHAFPAYDPLRSFSTWMYRIALNVAISYVRGERRREHHSVPFDESLHDTIQDDRTQTDIDERMQALQRVIAGLDRLSRALLLLYLEERNVREIAEILGLSETNVTTKISRLKQRIRSNLE